MLVDHTHITPSLDGVLWDQLVRKMVIDLCRAVKQVISDSVASHHFKLKIKLKT